MNDKGIERYIALYLPWLLAILFKSDPVVSYFIAWLGSVLIFYLTISGWVKKIPGDRSLTEQLMRPLFTMQIIFAGYMCCTTIFYFFNVIGYENFKKTIVYASISTDKLMLTAQCQRYYCLGHAALVTGILIFMDYPRPKRFSVKLSSLANLLLRIALISFPVAIIFDKVPGLSQFYQQFNTLSFIAGTLALAFAIPLKKPFNTLVCAVLYIFNFYQAFISGFKEPIIISIVVLGIFLYPNYKKLVISIFVPLIFTAFIFLPAYVNNFRQSAGTDNVSADKSSQLAIETTLHDNNDGSNWYFFVYRLSEVDMFTDYIQSTPAYVHYFGLTLLKQSVIAIIPRVIWPSKPITEDLVMERVYNAGVIQKGSVVSAKPAFIVDGYLSGGVTGIFISLLAYGAIAQLISNKAEELFGGYILGTALIFSGLFQIFWRGLSFEFLINSVFWSYISMLLIHKIFLFTNVLKPV